jgi:hypothetical protein
VSSLLVSSVTNRTLFHELGMAIDGMVIARMYCASFEEGTPQRRPVGPVGIGRVTEDQDGTVPGGVRDHDDDLQRERLLEQLVAAGDSSRRSGDAWCPKADPRRAARWPSYASRKPGAGPCGGGAAAIGEAGCDELHDDGLRQVAGNGAVRES